MMQLIFFFTCVIIGYITYKTDALDLLGSVFVAIICMLIVITSGFNWLILLLLFLSLGTAVTRYKSDYKLSIKIVHEKRTTKNVISNGIVPILMAVFGNYAGFIGSIASATADTFASEIGILSNPILITNQEQVKPGTDGGISVLGTVAGIMGTIIIGTSAYLLNVCPDITHSIIIALISGMAGCFVDSLLGATLERRGIFNNEHVNLSATIIGALVSIIIIGV